MKMVSDKTHSSSSSSKRNTSSSFSNSGVRRIFSDVAGDIIIVVDGQSFLLHKFPLVSWCGKIRKMLADGKGSSISKLELPNVPGGCQTFELAAQFCYGTNFEIEASNVANLRCAAEYLEMTEDYQEQNLILRTDLYMTEVVAQSLEKSIQVLSTCHSLLPTAEEIGLLDKCIYAISSNAGKEQLLSSLSRLECGDILAKPRTNAQEWWVEDLSVLKIDFFQRVIASMRELGIRPENITSSLIHYAQCSLKDVSKQQTWDSMRMKQSPNLVPDKEQIRVLETIVSMLPAERRTSIPLSFLFGMVKMAIAMGSSDAIRIELEKRISFQLDLVALDDLLIPSIHNEGSLFDTDMVHRILMNFFQWMEEEEPDESPSPDGYESDGLANSANQSSILKVGRLIDMYLAEIAPDPHLKLQKFMALIELMPDYARVIDDGLYRAIDVYIKAHPSLIESECRKLCGLIDCQKLSQEASSHAAQNERLPVQMTVRVIYFEQLRLKTSLGNTQADSFLSQKISSGIPSAAMSPRDNYASLRRENRELKLEISRMRVRLSELEKEQMVLKEGMLGKSGNVKTMFETLSKRIGKIGMFASANSSKRPKCIRRQGSDTKNNNRRRRNF